MILFACGASSAYGAWDTEGGWVARLRKSIDQKGFEDFVYNLGISGNTTADLIGRFDSEIRARLKDAEGDDEEIIILFDIGKNDSAEWENSVSPADYEKNLSVLIALAQKYTANIAFLPILPADERKTNPVSWDENLFYKNENIRHYNEIIQRVCDREKIVLIDITKLFVATDLPDLLEDGLHPNDKGHDLIFQEVQSALKKLGWIS